MRHTTTTSGDPRVELLGDHMTPKPITIDKDCPLSEAESLMRRCGFRHLPVMSRSRCVGILSDRDVNRAKAAAQVGEIRVRDAMTPDPVTFTPDTPLHEVALKMAGYRCGSCIVADKGGNILGIFTTIDALKVLAEMLRRMGVAGTRDPVAVAAPNRR